MALHGVGPNVDILDLTLLYKAFRIHCLITAGDQASLAQRGNLSRPVQAMKAERKAPTETSCSRF